VSDGEITAPQLTLDGGEDHLPVTRRSLAPFTNAQREILRLLVERDVTSTEAGRIIHLHRDAPCVYCRRGFGCPWASSDGNEALKRLMERGIVRRLAPGLWTATRR